MKIYLLEWEDCDMIGGFYDDSLEQCFNTTKSLLSFSLQHTMELKKAKSIEIEYIKSHSELNEMRKQRNMEQKPLLDTYISNLMKDYGVTER